MKLISVGDAQSKLNDLKNTLNVAKPIKRLDREIENIENEIYSLESEIDDLRARRNNLEDERDYLMKKGIKNKLSQDKRKELEAEMNEIRDYLKVITHRNQTHIFDFIQLEGDAQ